MSIRPRPPALFAAALAAAALLAGCLLIEPGPEPIEIPAAAPTPTPTPEEIEFAHRLQDLADLDPQTRLEAVEWFEQQALSLLPAHPDEPLPEEPVPGRRDQIIEILVRMLADPAPAVRARAAQALGRIGDQRAVPALVAALRVEPEAVVRQRLIATLADLGDRRAIPALLDRLEDENSWVRQLAQAALSRLTGQHFGYDWEDEMQLRAGLLAWRRWLAENEELIPPLLPPEPRRELPEPTAKPGTKWWEYYLPAPPAAPTPTPTP